MNNSFPPRRETGGVEAHWGLVRFAAFFYLSMALVALAWTGIWDHRWVWLVPPDQVWNGPFFNMLGSWGRTSLGLVAGISFGGLVAGLSRLGSGRVGWLDAMEEGFCDLLGPIGWRHALAMAALSALGEEFLFRGLVLPALGLGWSSLLFGLVHLPMDRRFVVWPLFAALVGVVFGAMALASGNIAGSVAAHFTVNFLNLLAIGRKAKKRRLLPKPPDDLHDQVEFP